MAGFLGLEDLTNSRGELALVVQTDKKNFSIEAVASLPDTSISSVQDAYLLVSLSPILPAFPRHKGQSEQHYKRQNPSDSVVAISCFASGERKNTHEKVQASCTEGQADYWRSSLTLPYSPKYHWRSIDGLTPVIPVTSALLADGPLLRRAEANCRQDS